MMMNKDETNKQKKRELDIEDLEKITGGAGGSNGLPPTVPEHNIDSTIKEKI